MTPESWNSGSPLLANGSVSTFPPQLIDTEKSIASQMFGKHVFVTTNNFHGYSQATNIFHGYALNYRNGNAAKKVRVRQADFIRNSGREDTRSP
jgi:hypothetical protein